jgi:histidinol dehydrogenase
MEFKCRFLFFDGNYTPEVQGLCFWNQSLPTNGFAKTYSGVNLDSYEISDVSENRTEKGIQNIGKV